MSIFTIFNFRNLNYFMTSNPDKYFHVVNSLKEKIRLARIKASNTVNTQLLQLYWEIGATILNEEISAGWGAKIVDKLAKDLRLEFSDMKGLSARNLRYMRDFASAYPHFSILQADLAKSQETKNELSTILQADLAKLSWYHHITLLDKIKDKAIRGFYIRKVIENGWTRDNMVHQIESGLHKRQGALTHNFDHTIQSYDSELTRQLFKDPYKFEFIGLGEEAKERDLEKALMHQIEKVLLELGEGFALYGRQHKLNAGDKEYFIDLLFYHTKLRRYVVIELKIGEFMPEYIGKMNLYLGLADDCLKGQYDEPTIGLILCKTKDKIVAEYALRDTSKPIGIAEYKITEMLPEDIKGDLPTIEEIERKLDEDIDQHQNPINARLKTVKERIQAIQGEKIQTKATDVILNNLFDKGLKPLFLKVIKKLVSTFEDDFMNFPIIWHIDDKQISSLTKLESLWKTKDYVEKGHEIQLNIGLQGFRNAGPNDIDASLTLFFVKERLWYGLSISGYNDDKPILKKMYHQGITEENMQRIEDIMVDQALDRIEWILDYLNKNND